MAPCLQNVLIGGMGLAGNRLVGNSLNVYHVTVDSINYYFACRKTATLLPDAAPREIFKVMLNFQSLACHTSDQSHPTKLG